MGRNLKNMIKEFKVSWDHFLLQSILATAVIFIVLLYLNIKDDTAIIASIGATTFVVFAIPNNTTAAARNVIGGHIVGLACGSLCALVPHQQFAEPTMAYSLVCAAAVGLTMFAMVTTDTEHAPAAGTALAVAIKGFSLNVTIAVLASAVILSLVRHVFRNSLKDLT